ncbi:hypothetical protein EDB89DRAFT_2172272 [Lactarius sanguifluus]|nr:hypothetical protein EDB89DRAFT_2172272 [Lactarius sanguifluus]
MSSNLIARYSEEMDTDLDPTLGFYVLELCKNEDLTVWHNNNPPHTDAMDTPNGYSMVLTRYTRSGHEQTLHLLMKEHKGFDHMLTQIDPRYHTRMCAIVPLRTPVDGAGVPDNAKDSTNKDSIVPTRHTVFNHAQTPSLVMEKREVVDCTSTQVNLADETNDVDMGSRGTSGGRRTQQQPTAFPLTPAKLAIQYPVDTFTEIKSYALNHPLEGCSTLLRWSERLTFAATARSTIAHTGINMGAVLMTPISYEYPTEGTRPGEVAIKPLRPDPSVVSDHAHLVLIQRFVRNKHNTRFYRAQTRRCTKHQSPTEPWECRRVIKNRGDTYNCAIDYRHVTTVGTNPMSPHAAYDQQNPLDSVLRILTTDAMRRGPEELPSRAETPNGSDAASGTLWSAREIFRKGLDS